MQAAHAYTAIPSDELACEGRAAVCALGWELMMTDHSINNVGQLFRYMELFVLGRQRVLRQAASPGQFMATVWRTSGISVNFANLTRLAAVSVLAISSS